ncbi:hypothetical protein ACJQWK_03387 [Exserohilum turcicum]
MGNLGEATGSSIVTLKVGPELKKFRVHKALLLKHSEYFRKALRGSWTEAKEGVVKIDDIEPAVVNIFVHWLYTQSLPKPCDYKEWSGFGGSAVTVNKLRAYIFADRFQIPSFGQAVHNNLVQELQDQSLAICEEYNLSLITEAYDGLPTESPILQLLVDTLCEKRKACAHQGPDDINKLPPAFLARVVRNMLHSQHHRQQKQVAMKYRCYYEHATEMSLRACNTRKTHMKFNHEKEFGFFGLCGYCEESNTSDFKCDFVH